MFEYLETKKKDTLHATIDLFHLDTDGLISGIPCKVIYDTALQREESKLHFIPFQLMRCGVRFTAMHDRQHEALQGLIRNYRNFQAIARRKQFRLIK